MASVGSQVIIHHSQSVSCTPFDIKWIPNTPNFVLLGENPNKSGTFEIFRLTGSGAESIQKLRKPSGLKCGTFGASLPGDQHLATGSFDGKLSIWDIENPTKPIFEVQAHENIINSIDGCGGLNIGRGAPEIATGGRDGSVKIWDPRQNIPVSCITSSDKNKRECWAVCFGNSFDDHHRSVCAGYDNGDIKMLDLTTQRIIWETNVGNGVCGLEFDRKDIQQNKLISTTLESSFQIFDLKTFHKSEGYANLSCHQHESTLWCGHHSPHDRDKWVTCGGNGEIKLWKYEYPKQRSLEGRGVMGNVVQIAEQQISTQPIASWDWQRNKKGLGACVSLDQRFNIVFITKI